MHNLKPISHKQSSSSFSLISMPEENSSMDEFAFLRQCDFVSILYRETSMWIQNPTECGFMLLQYSFSTSLPWNHSALYSSFLIAMTHSLPIRWTHTYTRSQDVKAGHSDTIANKKSQTFPPPLKSLFVHYIKNNYTIVKVLSHGGYNKIALSD